VVAGPGDTCDPDVTALSSGCETGEAASSTESFSVLIVDDNSAKRLALRAALWPLGCPVVEADSGLAALRCVLVADFAVILLDVRMPNMDGFETAARIRQRRQSECTPIIFITAFGSDELTSADSYAEGAVDFMFAPVEPGVLRAKVSAFGELFKRSTRLATAVLQSDQSAAQMRALTDALPIGIFQTDAHNRYTYTNLRWSEITGVTHDEAIGKKLGTLGIGAGVAQQAQFAAKLLSSASKLTQFIQRFELIQAGEGPRLVIVTSVPIRDTNGRMAGWVGTVADVTADSAGTAARAPEPEQVTARSLGGSVSAI
jgi:PAS domain S-box-containing protein